MHLRLLILILAAATLLAAEPVHPVFPLTPAQMKLVDEVDLGAADPGHRFQAWPDAAVAVRREILGKGCLTLPNPAGAPDRYVAVRLGEGKGLRAGGTYVLQIEYPEDAPRSLALWNTGNETCRGLHTGTTVGDALKMPFVFGNPESLDYPLARSWRTWTSVFELHPRYPELKRADERALVPADGFTLVVVGFQHGNDPTSQGPAVGRIRLYAVADPKVLALELRLPPAGLPRRHLFWREEMSDGVVDGKKGKTPGFDAGQSLAWYAAKMRLMRFLGMDTVGKDLLEFGHNQGWDSAKFGGNDWVYQSGDPQRWHGIVGLAGEMGLNLLPMYEYAGSFGSKGLATQKRCKTLAQAGKGPKGRDDYTHIEWSERGNADITDPDTAEDLRRMLEITIADEARRAHILGAWLRPRSSAMPVSFSDRCLALFAGASGRAAAPTRQQLQADPALHRDYLAWWLDRRHDFLVGVRDYLRKPEVLGDQGLVLFTGDPSEPGRILDGGGIVTDDPARFPGEKTVTFADAVSQRRAFTAMTSPAPTWGGWEWQHAVPQLDPQRYAATGGVLLTMAFSRQHSVSDPLGMQAFRGPDGLAMIRHHPLNEHVLKAKPLGYFVADFEEAGPYCMLAEARALALGDPRFIGYLAGNSFQRGFPEYVRAFNRAFLALPAVPGTRLERAASSTEVVVRHYPTVKHGSWFAVVNTGMVDAKDVRIDVRQPGLSDACTGAAVPMQGTVATVSLYPGQVLAWHGGR